MSELIRFVCECGQKFKAPGSKSGQRFSCPKCGSDVWVPDSQRFAQLEVAIPAPASPALSEKLKQLGPAKVTALGCGVGLFFCCLVPCLLSPFLPKSGNSHSPPPQRSAGGPQLPGISRRLAERIESVSIDGENVFIRFRVADNLSKGLVISGAQGDVRDLLKAVHSLGSPSAKVNIVGLMPLVDAYGNSTDTAVITLNYSRASLQKINWDRFLASDVFRIADPAFIHREFQ